MTKHALTVSPLIILPSFLSIGFESDAFDDTSPSLVKNMLLDDDAVVGTGTDDASCNNNNNSGKIKLALMTNGDMADGNYLNVKRVETSSASDRCESPP
mmetsp:Transcript_4522/g.8081  ORF Transcript_4522/g.8081 Transcript_4522/m.8081 type:complete len:99 (-) Transcript_4522:62-358(-)